MYVFGGFNDYPMCDVFDTYTGEVLKKLGKHPDEIYFFEEWKYCSPDLFLFSPCNRFLFHLPHDGWGNRNINIISVITGQIIYSGKHKILPDSFGYNRPLKPYITFSQDGSYVQLGSDCLHLQEV